MPWSTPASAASPPSLSSLVVPPAGLPTTNLSGSSPNGPISYTNALNDGCLGVGPVLPTRSQWVESYFDHFGSTDGGGSLELCLTRLKSAHVATLAEWGSAGAYSSRADEPGLGSLTLLHAPFGRARSVAANEQEGESPVVEHIVFARGRYLVWIEGTGAARALEASLARRQDALLSSASRARSTSTNTPSTTTTTLPAGTPVAKSGPQCQNGQLKTTAEATDIQQMVGLHLTYETLHFVNDSGSDCTLYGFPGVALANADGSTINAARSLGSEFLNEGGAPVPLASALYINLEPGQIASSLVQQSGATCGLTHYSLMNVTPPNLTQIVRLPGDYLTCSNTFVVGPVVPGSTAFAVPGSLSTTAGVPCRTDQLQVTDQGGNAAAGTTFMTLTFVNVTAKTCTLYGHPGVAALASQGMQAAQAQWTGFYGYGQPFTMPPHVSLAPLQVAMATVIGSDLENGPTDCPSFSALLVTPPNETQPIRVNTGYRTCRGQFAVTPVEPLQS